MALSGSNYAALKMSFSNTLRAQTCKSSFANGTLLLPKCAPRKTWKSSFAHGTLPFPNAMICKQCRAAKAQSATAADAVEMPLDSRKLGRFGSANSADANPAVEMLFCGS